jgi:flagellar basal-body rod protein FlgB
MDLLKSPLLSALTSRLSFLAARSGVIAENLANADTPNYAARDVRQADFRKLVAAPSLRTSDPRHIARAGSAGGGEIRTEAAPDPDASLNGNKVSIETQMMKLSETRMDYQLASTVYRKGVDMIRLAVRGGR